MQKGLFPTLDDYPHFTKMKFRKLPDNSLQVVENDHFNIIHHEYSFYYSQSAAATKYNLIERVVAHFKKNELVGTIYHLSKKMVEEIENYWKIQEYNNAHTTQSI